MEGAPTLSAEHKSSLVCRGSYDLCREGLLGDILLSFSYLV